MNSFLELARKRISVRGYEERDVEDSLVLNILEAGRLAPSAANKQPWHFILVRDPKQKEKLGKAYDREWFWSAPVVLVICVEPMKAWSRMDGKNYADVDGAIAVDHMTLAAADEGLGTCWIGAFNPHLVREVLGLPHDIHPLAMTPLGWPSDDGRPKKRKEMDEILHTDRWDK